jgi:hypothetical protein
VECICGALVIDERRTCPGCGRMIHPDAPVEIVGRPRHEPATMRTVHRTISKTKPLGTLPMFSGEQAGGRPQKQMRLTSLPNRQLPVCQGNELTQAFIGLRGSATRIVAPEGSSRWQFHSLHLALMGTKRDGKHVQIALSKWFILDDPDHPSAEALARLDDLRSQAEGMGFEQRTSLVSAQWFAIEFRPRVEWQR